MSHMSDNQETIRQFREDAVSLAQQLAALIGKLPTPERAAAIRSRQPTYDDLARRRGSLVLSPISAWAIDLLLDCIRARFDILTAPPVAGDCDAAGNLVAGEHCE